MNVKVETQQQAQTDLIANFNRTQDSMMQAINARQPVIVQSPAPQVITQPVIKRVVEQPMVQQLPAQNIDTASGINVVKRQSVHLSAPVQTDGQKFVQQVQIFEKNLNLDSIVPEIAKKKVMAKQKPVSRKMLSTRAKHVSRCAVFGSLSRKSGASTLAYNYAAEISRSGNRRVILIDMDFAEAGLSRMIYNSQGMSMNDSCGIEHVLRIKGSEYLSRLPLLTASVVTCYGNEISFIRSSMEYPVAVKEVLSRANFSKLLDLLKNVYTDIVIDVGNFLSEDKYKMDIFKYGAKVFATFDCKNKRTYMTSFDSIENTPLHTELILVNYNTTVNYIQLGQDTSRVVLGTMEPSKGFRDYSTLYAYNKLPGSTSSEWSKLVDNMISLGG